MLHKDIFEKFKDLFPQLAETVEEWFPNGRHSVRVRTQDNHEYAFTFHRQHSWSLETIDCFIERMKGGSKM